MNGLLSTAADLYQSYTTIKDPGPTGVYPPAVLLEIFLLVQHARTGLSNITSLAAKSLLIVLSLKDYCHFRILQRLGLYGVAVLFLQRLTTNRCLPATRLSLAHLTSSGLTLFLNARRMSSADLSFPALILRILGACARIYKTRRVQWSTLWTTLAMFIDSAVAFQITNMQHPPYFSQLPEVLVWPHVLSDEYISEGSMLRSANVKAGRLVVVRRRRQPNKQAFILAKPKSGIFSRPDRHAYFGALRDLHHPNIHQHENFIETWTNRYFVFEYVIHKPLFHFIDTFKRLPEGVAQQILAQVLDALEYIHGRSVTHRDVKMENILVDPRAPNVWIEPQTSANSGEHEVRSRGLCSSPWPASSVLLTNFDKMSTHIPQKGLMSGSQVGTAHYAAPEIQKKKYNCTVDIWALAVLGFVLLSAEFPFDADPSERSGEEVVRVVCRKRKVKWPVGNTVSVTAKECIEKMLTADPCERPTAAACRAHKWFTTPTRTSGGIKVTDFASVMAVSAHSPSLVHLTLRRKH